MAEPLNYAKQYSQALAQAFPYSLYFGALYASPNNQLYKVTGAKTIEIPIIKTKGRIDGDRDTITGFERRASNEWETKVLTGHREWSTLLHSIDVIQTNHVMTIQNATKVMNEEQKFPEMDANCVSSIYSLKVAKDGAADTTALTTDNVLTVFDTYMQAMDEARVPQAGRILYVTPAIDYLIREAKTIQQTRSVGDGGTVITRKVSRIDEVTIVPVPSDLMKTAYDFTEGWRPGASAKQINMFLVHTIAVMTPVNYTFAQLSEPSAVTKGKYVYFEEAFEDVFILNNRSKAITFNVAA